MRSLQKTVSGRFPTCYDASGSPCLTCPLDLAHEVIGRFVPLAAGEKVVHLPIHLHVAAPHSIYIRLHRRQGNKRVLADWEFAEWAERFARTRDQEAEIELEGPMWFRK